jgi:hypothetical protein
MQNRETVNLLHQQFEKEVFDPREKHRRHASQCGHDPQ